MLKREAPETLQLSPEYTDIPPYNLQQRLKLSVCKNVHLDIIF